MRIIKIEKKEEEEKEWIQCGRKKIVERKDNVSKKKWNLVSKFILWGKNF